MNVEMAAPSRHFATSLRPPGQVDAPPGFVPFFPRKDDQSIADRFTRVARQHADRVAVRYGDQSITFGELDTRSNRLARTLTARCGPGSQPIAILFDKGIPFFVACFGVWKAGKFVVPLDPHHPPARIERIWEDVAAQYLLSDTANQALGERIAGDGACNLDTLELDPRGDALDLLIDPETPSAIFYTSGSTGQPKGVVQLQRNLLMSADSYADNMKLHPQDRVGFVYSLCVGISYLIFTAALLAGAGVHPANLMEIGMDGLVVWLHAEEITFVQCVPSLFRRLAAATPPGTTFPHLRLIILGGELSTRGDVDLFRRHFDSHTALANNYGYTEGTPIRQYVLRPDDAFDQTFMPVGYPMMGMEVRILGPDGDELPPGEIGEIVVTTRYLAPGYWRNPEATARSFRFDPADPGVRHYYSGDLGSLQPDGCLTCHGRKDFQVKIRGFRVETAEVELALQACPTVKEAVVLAFDDGRGDKALAAYLVPRGDDQPSTVAMQQYLRERLPDYMIPAAIGWLAEMPQTPTGKIDRLALPAPVFGSAQDAYAPPCSPLEEALARIWTRVLGVERVGRHDDFFALGGHSLLAPQLFALIEEQLGQRLPLATLFQASTVADLAALLQQQGWTPPWSSLTPIQPHGSLRPFFCVHPAGGNILMYRELARLLGPDQPFYGLQENRADASVAALESIEEMATYYLRQLRALQPEGPYLLGGYSFGGVVAFEMARQLREAGQQVPLLALFDTTCPTFHPPKAAKNKKRLLHTIRHIGLLPFVYSRPASLVRYFERKFIRALYHWCLRTGRRFPPRLRTVGRSVFYRITSKRYRPLRYPANLTLFRVTGSLARPTIEGDLGWGTVVEGAIEIHTIPGHHDDLLKPGQIEVLAEKLHACLQRAHSA
ncbi:MAG: AMP-binding protein [Armatimonadota bacterium]